AGNPYLSSDQVLLVPAIGMTTTGAPMGGSSTTIFGGVVSETGAAAGAGAKESSGTMVPPLCFGAAASGTDCNRVMPASLEPRIIVASPTRATTSARFGPRLAVSRIWMWRRLPAERRREK